VNTPDGIPLLRQAYQDWYCPNGCNCTDRTRPLPPGASQYHACPRLHGLNAPLVRAGTDCKVVAVERAHYLNGEVQATGDDGKPYMAIKTEYADGHNDLAVNAGLATGKMVT
jgi:hypothetical protein